MIIQVYILHNLPFPSRYRLERAVFVVTHCCSEMRPVSQYNGDNGVGTKKGFDFKEPEALLRPVGLSGLRGMISSLALDRPMLIDR